MSITGQPESATDGAPLLAVSVRKGAVAVGVSLSTMWTLIRQGKIPTKKVGMRTLIRVRDLETFSAGGNVEINQPARIVRPRKPKKRSQ